MLLSALSGGEKNGTPRRGQGSWGKERKRKEGWIVVVVGLAEKDGREDIRTPSIQLDGIVMPQGRGGGGKAMAISYDLNDPWSRGKMRRMRHTSPIGFTHLEETTHDVRTKGDCMDK